MFIVGAPRSGTSLLYRTICLHPDAAWINNWHRRLPGLAEVSALNRLAHRLPDTRQRAWFPDGNAYVYGRRRGAVARTFPNPVEGEPVFEHCGVGRHGPAAGQSPAAVSAALQSMVARVTRASGSRVFVNKRIGHNHRIEFLATALPGARFVHVVRDGRSVASSLRRVDWWPEHELSWWSDGTPTQWEAAGHDPWVAAGREWTEEITAATAGLAVVDDDRQLVVRYERLIADPRRALTEVAEFAGLDPLEPAFVRGVEAIRTRDDDRSWESLPTSVQATLFEVQGDVLEHWDHA